MDHINNRTLKILNMARQSEFSKEVSVSFSTDSNKEHYHGATAKRLVQNTQAIIMPCTEPKSTKTTTPESKIETKETGVKTVPEELCQKVLLDTKDIENTTEYNVTKELKTNTKMEDNTSDIDNISFILFDIPEVTDALIFGEIVGNNCDNHLCNVNQSTESCDIMSDNQTTEDTVLQQSNDNVDEIPEPESYSTNHDPDWENISDENVSNGIDNDEASSKKSSEKRKRRKRHFVNEKTWDEVIQKKKREGGQDYLGRKKIENKWRYDIKKKRRILREKCNCKLSLGNTALQCTKITDNDREKIFNNFWTKMDWNQRKMYVSFLVCKKVIARQRNRKDKNSSHRQTSLDYFLKRGEDKIRVCKNMFLNTHGVGEHMISNWIKDKNKYLELGNSDERELTETETQRNQQTENNLTRRNKSRYQIDKLKEFFNELPKMESHYCRATSSKLYLEPSWHSKSELYNFYASVWCADKQLIALSIASFYHVFDELNLAIFAPKKDECDTCVAYRTGNLAEEVYLLHQEKKIEARDEKCKDKVSNHRVCCMDLQSVLLSPKSNVSSLYFKTKLIVHNFTVFDMKTTDGYCHLWHEAAGGVAANNYASIICKFLEENVISTILPEQNIIKSNGGRRDAFHH